MKKIDFENQFEEQMLEYLTNHEYLKKDSSVNQDVKETYEMFLNLLKDDQLWNLNLVVEPFGDILDFENMFRLVQSINLNDLHGNWVMCANNDNFMCYNIMTKEVIFGNLNEYVYSSTRQTFDEFLLSGLVE